MFTLLLTVALVATMVIAVAVTGSGAGFVQADDAAQY